VPRVGGNLAGIGAARECIFFKESRPFVSIPVYRFFSSLTQENHMETSARGNSPPTSAMSGNGEDALLKASSRVHAAVNSIAGAVDEVAIKASPAVNRMTAMAHQAVDKAADAAAPTAGWLTEKSKSLNATQKKLVADTSNYVAVNPLKALGIAVVAGFLLSRIIL
jgi:ElaB/YqjD/DUF883 family membrane-anchored ribosome-binding protein